MMILPRKSSHSPAIPVAPGSQSRDSARWRQCGCEWSAHSRAQRWRALWTDVSQWIREHKIELLFVLRFGETRFSVAIFYRALALSSFPASMENWSRPTSLFHDFHVSQTSLNWLIHPYGLKQTKARIIGLKQPKAGMNPTEIADLNSVVPYLTHSAVPLAILSNSTVLICQWGCSNKVASFSARSFVANAWLWQGSYAITQVRIKQSEPEEHLSYQPIGHYI